VTSRKVERKNAIPAKAGIQKKELKIKNDRVKMKNSKSETLNSKQYQNPNDRNRKKEKGFGNLNFGNLNLFRIWDLAPDS